MCRSAKFSLFDSRTTNIVLIETTVHRRFAYEQNSTITKLKIFIVIVRSHFRNESFSVYEDFYSLYNLMTYYCY